MELKEFIDIFIETLELEDASNINAQTDFKSLDDWDSLASLSIISMVDDRFGVTINKKEVRACDTIEDFCKINFDDSSERFSDMSKIINRIKELRSS